MKQEFTRIAVKVGSNVLARRDGTLDVTRMSALVDQIAELNKSGDHSYFFGSCCFGTQRDTPAEKARQCRPAPVILRRRTG